MSFVKEAIAFALVGVYSAIMKNQIIVDPFSEVQN